MIFVSIAEKAEEISALKKAINFSTLSDPQIDCKRCNLKCRSLLIPRKAVEQPHSIFESIAAEFSQWVAQSDVTVLVSQVHPMQLNPLLSSGMESVLAMLILAFPDVRWFFGTVRGYGEKDEQENELNYFRTKHGLYNLFQPRQSTLFDGTGLRDWVRKLSSKGKDTKHDARYIPDREQLAIAIDEETDYAHLHAYTAYRFGFRALAISKLAAADTALGPNAKSTWEAPEVVLEDLFLNFPSGGRALSYLGTKRHDSFPLLEEAKHRILVTSGQRVAGDNTKNAENRRYIAEQGIRFLYKPHAGIFAVWEKSGLERKLYWREETTGKLHRGTGKNYVWPPVWRKIKKKPREEGKTDGSGHSSPGILLLIARHLLTRAESMLDDGLSSVEKAVHCAVLANEALEILGGMTPTTAAEALSLKHQFELHAECQFTGVEHHIPLHHRLKEIKRDAESIARWFRPQESRRAALNIQMSIVNQLAGILREYNQFDEEQESMNHVRYLHNSLYMCERPWRVIFWPVLRYSEFLLSSFSKFTLALILWVGGLTWLFNLMPNTPSLADNANNLKVSSFGQAMQTFLGNDIVTSYGFWVESLSVVAIIAGLAHLGIFISHLYSLVSRR